MINWGSLLLVTVATLTAAVAVVTLFSYSVRLAAEADDAKGRRRTLLQTASWVTTGLCGVAVLLGLYLIIPYFGG